jgi:hypothetical protein
MRGLGCERLYTVQVSHVHEAACQAGCRLQCRLRASRERDGTIVYTNEGRAAGPTQRRRLGDTSAYTETVPDAKRYGTGRDLAPDRAETTD